MSNKNRGQVAREHTALSLALADVIAGERGAHRLTQEEAATRAGMTLVTYRRIEKQVRPATLPQIEQLAAAFGKEPETLVAMARQRMNETSPAATDEHLDRQAAALDVDAEVKRRARRNERVKN